MTWISRLIDRNGSLRSVVCASPRGASARLMPLAFLLCAIGLSGWSVVPHTAHSQAAPAGALTVTAKLVEIPSKPPPDDLYDYAYVMRYQVIGGPLDKTSILVAHYRPLVPRSKVTGKMKAFVAGKLRSFVQGDVHKLKLSPDLRQVWKGELVDDFEATDRKSVRYWCLEADPG